MNRTAPALTALATLSIAGAAHAGLDFELPVALDTYSYSFGLQDNDRLIANDSATDTDFNAFIALKFDLTNLPTEPVSSAFLTLEKFNGALAGTTDDNTGDFAVYQPNWDVATLLPGPAFPDGAPTSVTEFRSTGFGDEISRITLGDDGYYSWDITALVNAWIGGADNLGLVITGIALTNDDPENPAAFHNPYFVSSLGDGLAPVIASTAVPAPGAATLLGALGLCAARRRR